jgi:thiol-disulfide isomerase/thioredoxin
MRVDRILVWLLPLVGGLAAHAADGVKAPRLQLAFGDTMVGTLAESPEPDVIAWQCAAARDPYRFPMTAISAAHFPRSGETSASDAEYMFELSGGDVLLGSLAKLTADAIVIDTPQLGEISIAASHVKRITRRDTAGASVYVGPDGLTGWTLPEKESPWREEGGHLVVDKPATASLPACAVPAKAVIELELSWKRRADFSLRFGSSSTQLGAKTAEAIRRLIDENLQNKPKAEAPTALFSLEVWNRTLVLVRETADDGDIAPIAKLPAGAGRTQLNLYYDQAAGTVAAYAIDGKLLAKVEVPEGLIVPGSGIELVNTAGDLRLEHLAVRHWGGEPPVEIDQGRTYVQRGDGSITYAKSVAYEPTADEFVLTVESGEPLSIAAAEVQGAVFATEAEMRACTVRTTMHDGARISGQLLKVVDGAVHLQRPGAASPLAIPIGEVRSLASLAERSSGALAKGRVGIFESEGVRLDGVLADADSANGPSCLVWHPQGSLNSSPLVSGLSGRIVYRTTAPAVKKGDAEQKNPRRVAQAQPLGFLGALNNVLTGRRAEGTKSVPAGDANRQLLWLVNGDRIPCELIAIDDRGVTFKSSVIQTEFLPHDQIKAWERVGGSSPSVMEEKKRARLLTLPRMQRENPPTHLLEFQGGDYLRGRLESMDGKTLRVEVRLESKPLAAERVTRIIWLSDGEGPTPVDADAKANEDAVTTSTAGALAEAAEPSVVRDQSPGEGQLLAEAPTDGPTQLQAVRSDGVRLTFTPERVADSVVHGRSERLGPCQVALGDVDQFLLGAAIAKAAADLQYHDWFLRPAPDPKFASTDAAGEAPSSSELAGKPAPDVKLDLLDGGRFELAREKGHVVVLDFWASWCGPCMQAMPQLDELAKELEGQDVRFYAVNLQEDRETVEQALERLGVTPKVVLDIDGAAAEKYAVAAIPQTVVIDRQGNVVDVMVGGGPDFAERLRELIDKAIADAAASDPPATN